MVERWKYGVNSSCCVAWWSTSPPAKPNLEIASLNVMWPWERGFTTYVHIQRPWAHVLDVVSSFETSFTIVVSTLSLIKMIWTTDKFTSPGARWGQHKIKHKDYHSIVLPLLASKRFSHFITLCFDPNSTLWYLVRGVIQTLSLLWCRDCEAWILLRHKSPTKPLLI